MADLVDRTIAVLRSEHESLAGFVSTLTDDQLGAASGADEWTVSDVLSHLGSGAEIGRAPIAIAAGETVQREDNQAIWDRWDAASPHDQAAGFVERDTQWVETVEALTPEQRTSLTVDLGFLPEPVPLVTALGMRLNEVASHSWDARVAIDPAAEVNPEPAAVLVDLFAGPLSFLVGFIAKPAELSRAVSLAIPGGALVIGDTVAIVPETTSSSATFRGAPGTFIRLLNGRLKPPYDQGTTVDGDVTLDDLRRVFPGY